MNSESGKNVRNRWKMSQRGELFCSEPVELSKGKNEGEEASSRMTEDRFLLIGCGILKNEVRYLIRKNNWPLDTVFFDSALHCEFDKLSRVLTAALTRYKDRRIIVFYGACHPLMEKMLGESGTFRTEGQNCVDMLLGHELFMEELAKGAFFLLQEWAHRWKYILTKSFGTGKLGIISEIFREDRKYLLCLRTPCSGDFTSEAEEAGRVVGLPLRWMDVTLDHLASVLRAAIARKKEETQCRR